jgi:hypothetical protein
MQVRTVVVGLAKAPLFVHTHASEVFGSIMVLIPKTL